MASFGARAVDSTSTGFDEVKSYYDQIMGLNSRHKEFMTEMLRYKVYVDKPFVGHHYLVLIEEEGRCERVTFELTVIEGESTDSGESYQVAPKARLYTDGLTGLDYKGEIYSTLEHICEVAYRVLVDMGSYNAALNNCQDFCNNLLKKFNLPGYTTDAAKIAIGAAVGVGAVVVGYGLYKLLSNDDNEKEKRKNEK